MKSETTQSDEIEINLSELWAKVRKGWKLTLLLVILSLVAAGIYTSRLPKIYQISAAINLGSDQNGNPISNLTDILALVKQGSLNERIISELHLDERQYASLLSSNLTAKAGNNSELIYLYYATADPDTGKEIISALVHEVQKIYSPKTEKDQKNLEPEIQQAEEQISLLKCKIAKINSNIEVLNKNLSDTNREYATKTNIIRMQEDSTRKQIVTLNSRISLLRKSEGQLGKTIKMLEENTRALLKAKSEISSDHPKGVEIFSNILYANNMQQNLVLIDEVYARRKKYLMEINDVQGTIVKLQTDLSTFEEKIKQLEIEKDKKITEYQHTISQLTLQRESELPAKKKLFDVELSALKTQQTHINNVDFAIAPDYINIPESKMKKNMLMAGLFALLAGCLVAILKQQAD